jgi:hypothetical protein
MNTKFFSENLEERDHSEYLSIDRRVIGKYGGKVWTGCMWLGMGTSGSLL